MGILFLLGLGGYVAQDNSVPESILKAVAVWIATFVIGITAIIVLAVIFLLLVSGGYI